MIDNLYIKNFIIKCLYKFIQVFKFYLLGIIFLFLFSNTFVFSFDTTAKSAIVYDETTNSILFEKLADKPLPPASMSKLMTLLLTFEALEEKRISLSTKFRVSEKASKKGGSTMFLEKNQLVSVEDLIKGISVVSGNDACIVLAEGLNGTEESFVQRMNLKVKDLGLKNSNFNNSTGWPSPGHVMSVRDLLKIAIIIKNEYPNFYKYFLDTEFTWNEITQPNRNPLLNLNLGVDGLKTGHTNEAGYGLVASSKLGKRRVTLVIAGTKSKEERKLEGEKLLQWAYRDFKIVEIFPKDHFLGKAPIWIGAEDYVELKTNEKIEELLPYGKLNEIKAEVHVNSPIAAPIDNNQEIGTLKIFIPSFIEGEKDRVVEHPIVSKSNISKGGFAKKFIAALKVSFFQISQLFNLKKLLN
ncbi:MAG: D-alanyl-D-alanine carboxypeptidase family protein [Paracoccaceae bacterium]